MTRERIRDLERGREDDGEDEKGARLVRYDIIAQESSECECTRSEMEVVRAVTFVSQSKPRRAAPL
jgi:hypothetical protein